MKRDVKKAGGFTLVELMAVVVIIGILASFATIKVAQYLSTARITKARADMKRIMQALELYNMEIHEYPESLEELTAETEERSEGIISGIPKDPWGNDYEYVSGTENGYDLICYGRDGVEGGEGEDADIYSWEMDQGDSGEGSSEGYSDESGG